MEAVDVCNGGVFDGSVAVISGRVWAVVETAVGVQAKGEMATIKNKTKEAWKIAFRFRLFSCFERS